MRPGQRQCQPRIYCDVRGKDQMINVQREGTNKKLTRRLSAQRHPDSNLRKHRNNKKVRYAKIKRRPTHTCLARVTLELVLRRGKRAHISQTWPLNRASKREVVRTVTPLNEP